jgi:hypothetical protein
LIVVEVGHEAAEHRDHKKIENTQPDKEGLGCVGQGETGFKA